VNKIRTDIAMIMPVMGTKLNAQVIIKNPGLHWQNMH
jgi:ABC-type long-subunit fatty acid transport system fused permease/ATPase subunit